MKAIRLHGRGGPHHLVYEDAPQPRPGAEEVLVRVYATGVIASELQWDVTYQTKAGSPRALPIPGRDLSGVREAAWGCLPSNWLTGQARTSSRPPRRAIATSCANWEPTRSSTTPPRASKKWFTGSISSSIL